jgi:hypothetical protein
LVVVVQMFSGSVAVSSRRRVIGTAIFFMGMNRTLWMISGILDPFNSGSFQCLVGVRQLFDGLVVGVLLGGESLRISRLSRTSVSHLSGIRPKLVQLRFEAAC